MSPVEPRKLIIDCDPGIDDAVALAMALFDPRLDVLAVTATAGNVSAEQATANLQAVVTFLDPPRLPRVGVAAADAILSPRPLSVHGSDGLGGLELPRVPPRLEGEPLAAWLQRAGALPPQGFPA